MIKLESASSWPWPLSFCRISLFVSRVTAAPRWLASPASVYAPPSPKLPNWFLFKARTSSSPPSFSSSPLPHAHACSHAHTPAPTPTPSIALRRVPSKVQLQELDASRNDSAVCSKRPFPLSLSLHPLYFLPHPQTLAPTSPEMLFPPSI